MEKEGLLKNKKILVTGGPVWVPIDRVRVITNIFGGTLGFLIAQKAASLGAEVVFLLGPGRVDISNNTYRNLKISRFKYFEELLGLMKLEIFQNKFDAVIHSAAVPDYMPKETYSGKIKSGKDNFSIEFKRNIKIIDLIKDWNPDVFLVKFKLEVGLSQKELIDIAYNSMIFSKADLIIANDLENMKDGNYKGFIIDKNKSILEFNKKDLLADELLNIISKI